MLIKELIEVSEVVWRVDAPFLPGLEPQAGVPSGSCNKMVVVLIVGSGH